MIDAIGEGLRATSIGSPVAYPLVFVAGIVTSIGPCVAPRYVAVAALAGASRYPWRPVTTFALGVVAAYVAIGSTVSALTFVQRWSTSIDVALAAVLAIAGLITLLRANSDHHRHTSLSAGAGGTLLLGASSAFVVSPCCTPVVAAIAGFTTLGGKPLDGALLMATFALGHIAPLVILAALGTRLASWSARLVASPIPSVIGGTLMLALAAYYGVVA